MQMIAWTILSTMLKTSHLKNFLERMESVKLINPEPTYLTADAVISEETAKTLMELVDERGKRSDWSYNPDCLEFQIANPFAAVMGENDEKIISVLPELFVLGENFLRHLNQNFNNTLCEVVTGYHGFWILKYLEQGQFDKHCDWDSTYTGIAPPVVGTVAVLLNDDFRGGEMLISDNRGAEKLVKGKKYSATLWDGWTQHRIAPVTEGTRYTLVMHYTGTVK